MNNTQIAKINQYANSFIDKIKKDKKALFIVIIGLLAIFLITLSGSSEQEDTQEDIDTSTSSTSYTTNEDLTNQLIVLLEQIEGAGSVSAMITFDSTQEVIYAYDYSESYSNDDDSSSNNYENEYIIIDEDSNENGLIVKTIYPTIRGVAIVCDGADNAVVKQRIISTVSALFDISSAKISVAQVAQ